MIWLTVFSTDRWPHRSYSSTVMLFRKLFGITISFLLLYNRYSNWPCNSIPYAWDFSDLVLSFSDFFSISITSLMSVLAVHAISTIFSWLMVTYTSNLSVSTSSSIVPSLSITGALDRASTCAIFIPERCCISYSYSCKRSCHIAIWGLRAQWALR